VAIAAVSEDMLAVSLDVSAVPSRPGGAGYYTIEMARGLLASDQVALSLVARQDDEDRWNAMAAATTTGPSGAVIAAVPNARPRRLLFEQARFPSLLRTLGVDLHHAPHYTMPGRSPVPCVVTIHDCTFFDHPEWHLRSKAILFRRAIRLAAHRAGALVCVSEVTATRLRAVCDVRSPIVVAPHGVDHQRFTTDEPSPGSDEAALAQAGIPTGVPLVVFIGTLEPRKGLAPLVEAFDRVAGAHADALLVLGGQMGWGLAETERALAQAVHGDRIIRTGYLADAAVPALLRRATVVAYPALEEGFGLPALEALACGAPLITTEGTAMAEMAGAAATLVPPGDPASLGDALAAALDEGKEGAANQARRVLGLQVAGARTWSASVARHLEAYRIALSGSL
jgi:glycosyltransferase involved in cell wall biosynthesis